MPRGVQLVAALSAVARELTAAGAAMCRRPALVVGRGGEARGAWRVSVGEAHLVILYERRRGGNSSLPAFRCSVPNRKAVKDFDKKSFALFTIEI